jgi:hypothetical protein
VEPPRDLGAAEQRAEEAPPVSQAPQWSDAGRDAAQRQVSDAGLAARLMLRFREMGTPLRKGGSQSQRLGYKYCAENVTLRMPMISH